ncbi:hypothetical protein K0M31_011648 [Melipona bicolor]|uniref:Uncharacterized protein n=1 Tax=Melipona bicolor TaxID=60889 RepID=A0AA40GA61_9HYME|nr:hypothetical protein K0M31_011648 [Melipona bicolor]
MVVASYDGNTGNAALIHPGQAERPLHRALTSLFSLLRQWSIVEEKEEKEEKRRKIYPPNTDGVTIEEPNDDQTFGILFDILIFQKTVTCQNPKIPEYQSIEISKYRNIEIPNLDVFWNVEVRKSQNIRSQELLPFRITQPNPTEPNLFLLHLQRCNDYVRDTKRARCAECRMNSSSWRNGFSKVTIGTISRDIFPDEKAR